MDATARKIIAMLKENTGKAMCDSGGENGRHWQHNQARKFMKEPDVELSFKYGSIDATLNIFHFLNNNLTYDPILNKIFQKFCKTNDPNEEYCWLESMQNFCAELYSLNLVQEKPSGPYYTYNEDNLLSQDVQFVYFTTQNLIMYGFEVNDGPHVLIQVANGADARGGLTSPKAFSCENEYGIGDYNRAAITCSKDHDEHYWSTDDGSNWYYQGNCSKTEQLDEYEFEFITDEKDWRKGKLCANKELDIGYCPLCGGVLKAFY